MIKLKNVAKIVLAAVMLFGICAMSAGCSGSDKVKELQQQITELETRTGEQNNKIAELENKISEQDGKIGELEAEIDNQNDKNEKLDTENKKLVERIRILELKTSDECFYTLADAYACELFTQADLLSIAYYYHGGIRFNEEIMGEDYTPLKKNPEVLSEETDVAIRQAYFEKYFKNHKNITLDDLTVSYYGTYNNCVAFMVWCGVLGYPAVVWGGSVCGVIFRYPWSNEILVWVNK